MILRRFRLVSVVLLLFVESYYCFDASLLPTASRQAWFADDASPSPSTPPELFAVAPMMAHTNRHYRYFVRLLSAESFLYTEMVPASQVVSACRRILSDQNDNRSTARVVENIQKLVRDDSLAVTELHNLLGHAFGSLTPVGPTVLQLGGNDCQKLELASAIGTLFGYTEINLNCGCPSNAVGGRQGGVALMNDPQHVASLVQSMNRGIETASQHFCPRLTMKHRLGAQEASTFDAEHDRTQDDAEAYQTCRNFVDRVASTGVVSKFHVHARLGLLGEFQTDGDPSATRKQSLWVPGQEPANSQKVKIDHKREQERARRRARRATIQNRSVPPLRPGVVAKLADDYPALEFVTNGGIQSLSQVETIVKSGKYGTKENLVTGAMVGRTAINHPCAFAAAGTLWTGSRGSLTKPTRGQVLSAYLDYCDNEEDQAQILIYDSSEVKELRRRLVAVPFHLFTGEEGSSEFQRRIAKLTSRSASIRARSVLEGAAMFVPHETLNKPVDQVVPWDKIEQFNCFQRSGSLQRVVF